MIKLNYKFMLGDNYYEKGLCIIINMLFVVTWLWS